MAVSETAYGDSGGKIEILPPVTVPQSAAFASGEENIGFRIGLHDVFVVEFDVFLGQRCVHLQISFRKYGFSVL